MSPSILTRAGAVALLLLAVPPLRAQQPAARALSLDQAFLTAEGKSEQVRIAHAAVDRAHGQQWQARSQYLPQLNAQLLYVKTLASPFSSLAGPPDARPACRTFAPVGGAATSNRLDSLERAVALATNCRAGGGIDFSKAGFGAKNQYQLGLSASLNLFTGGRVSGLNRSADAAFAVAETELQSQRAQLAITVAQAYFDAALADRLLTIAESSFVQTDAVFRATQLSNTVGNSAEFELLRAQVTRDNQRPVLSQRRADRNIAHLRLKQVLNVPVQDSLVLTTSLADDDPSAVKAVLASFTRLDVSPDTASGNRAVVRQAAEAVHAQQAQFRVTRAQRFPNVTLTSAYGRVAYSPEVQVPTWDSFLDNWTVSLTASFPLFTGGRLYGDEMVAKANLAEAQARYDQARQGASVDARQALNQIEQAEIAWRASAGTGEQAARAYRIAEVRYREGISTQIELSDSRILLQQAQANRALAARNLQVARLKVALLKDLPLNAGGSLASPVGGAQQQSTSTQAQSGQGTTQGAGASGSQGTIGGITP